MIRIAFTYFFLVPITIVQKILSTYVHNLTYQGQAHKTDTIA